jgi:hypothetical protein
MTEPKKLRGFAKLRVTNPALLKEISIKASQRAHETGHAHRFTTAEAKAARALQDERMEHSMAFVRWCDKIRATGEPCRQDLRCFEEHRCPFDPVCNN